MHFLFDTAEATKSIWEIWAPVVVQIVITIGAIFGGAGFWQYKQAKLQAARDKESKETGVENKVDTLSNNMTALNSKVDNLSHDMKDLKADLALLQQANEETIKYRNARDNADQATLHERHAIIESLKGLMRERLLDVYNKCVKKGFYTKEEREVYKPLYECYKSEPFNGNGVIKDLHYIMIRLPLNSDGAPITDDD